MRKTSLLLMLLFGVLSLSSEAALGGNPSFEINIDPIGHWHVFKSKNLKFKVNETASKKGKIGLNVVVEITRSHSERVTELSVAKGQVKDEGNGIYSLSYTPSSIGAYAIVANFLHDGQLYSSKPVAVEVARDGEEGIRVDARGTSHVYQIRYNWEPGHVHASDKNNVKLVFELMRGVQTGEKINWKKPWMNTFNHLTGIEGAEVIVESQDGQVKDTLNLIYKGKGIYEAERIFTIAEVGKKKDYNIRLVFIDPYNGGKVTHSKAYPLHAVSPH